MTFIQSRSDIDVCNKSLSRIGQAQLSGTLGDPANNAKQAGRECNLHYKSTVRGVLEAHHWNLATRRQQLVEVTNDRSLEWSFAYAAPDDIAFPVGLHAPGDNLGSPVAYYRGLKGLIATVMGRPLFTYSNRVIYSFVGPAELEYVSLNITEQEFTQQVEDVIVLFLASKLAYSLAKDHRMGNEIKQEAIAEMDKAIANNLNEQGQTYGDGPSESEFARRGTDPWLYGYGVGY